MCVQDTDLALRLVLNYVGSGIGQSPNGVTRLVSIDAWPKWPFLLAHGPGVVVINFWNRFCTLGRASHTKETLPDFCEWCRVTRHPRVFRRLMGRQRDLREWGVTSLVLQPTLVKVLF